MVFQSADAQLFNPTVRDEVAFGPLHLDLPRDEILARVDDTLAMLGLGALADRAPYNLSGGEKKKVALASVLSINPEVLMLDEPTNGLDPRTQEWLIELLEQLHRAGKTIVVATHQLDRPGAARRPRGRAGRGPPPGRRRAARRRARRPRSAARRSISSTSTPTTTGRCCTRTRTRTRPARERHGEDEPEHHHEHREAVT